MGQQGAHPELARAQIQLGQLLTRLGRFAPAVRHFSEAIRLEPRNAPWHKLLGAVLVAAGQVDAAIAAFEAAVALHPRHGGIRVNLGNTLVDLNRAEDSLPHYEHAIAALPQLTDLRASYAMALEALGRYDAADRELRAVLALDDAHPDALFCLGLRALLARDYAAGWRGYDYRWSRRALHSPMRQFRLPRWNGEPLAGKCLLIHAEQGIGDEIMFASVLPEVIAAAAHCIVECSPKLADVFRTSFPAATIVATDRNDPDWFTSSPAMLAQSGSRAADLQIPAGSLPSLRRQTLSDFPRHHGYLRADPARVEHRHAAPITAAPAAAAAGPHTRCAFRESPVHDLHGGTGRTRQHHGLPGSPLAGGDR